MERSAFLRQLKVGVEMNKLKVDRSKNKNLSKQELLLLSKEELVNIVIQLQASNLQLKNVIAKKNDEQTVKDTRKDGTKARQFDFSRYQTRRIFLRIAYLGGNYRGLAVQDDCPDTVEFHLFRALEKGCLIKSRAESHYHRCGRTDKGVSASGQVLSIEVRSCLSLDEQLSRDGGRTSELSYCKILNRLLPPDIRAIAWLPAPMSDIEEYYSARFDCKQRTYKYWFPCGSLDLKAMSEACRLLQGSWDFRNLCKMDVANGVTAFIRDVKSVRIVAENPGVGADKGYAMHYLLVSANAFLWHQIRCIAGILFLVGGGYESPSIITELLDVKTNPRKPQYNMAIDLPLNLFHCAYEFLHDYEETTRFTSEADKTKTKKYRNSINDESESFSKENNLQKEIAQTVTEVNNVKDNLSDVEHNKNIKDIIELVDVTNTSIDSNINVGTFVDGFSEVAEDNSNEKNVSNTTEDSVRDTLLIEDDSLMNDLSCQELDKIEENIRDSDKRENERFVTENTLENVTNNEEESCVDGVRNKSSQDEPMQHSDDENMMLSGKFELKKDWWYVDLEDLSIVIKNFQSQWSRSAIQASMTRDIIDDLENLYNKELSSREQNDVEKVSEESKGNTVFMHQSDCMLQGVSPKVYQPLLKRSTCESLENRIEHYVKKKRLRRSSEES